MHESVKTVLLAAIGALALSYEKATSLVEDLVKKGQITVAEGKQINEELKRTMAGKMRGQAAGQTVSPPTDGDRPLTLGGLKEALNELGLATRADIEELKDRLGRPEKSGGSIEK